MPWSSFLPLHASKIEFGKFFYLPLVALHLSLIVRLVWGLDDRTGAPRGRC